VKSFRAIAETEDPLAHYPEEELHADVHRSMLKHGYAEVSRSPGRHMARWADPNPFDDEPQTNIHGLMNDLRSHGFPIKPGHDYGEEEDQYPTHRHPNGMVLQQAGDDFSLFRKSTPRT
jgi:hypothetical protein